MASGLHGGVFRKGFILVTGQHARFCRLDWHQLHCRVEEHVAAVTFYDHTECKSKHLLIHLPHDLLHKSESGSCAAEEASALEMSTAIVQNLFRCFALTVPHQDYKAEITAANMAFQVR